VISPWHEVIERKAATSVLPVDTGVDWLPALPVAILAAGSAVAGAA